MLLLASSVCCLFKRRQFDPEVLLRSDCHRTETVNGGSVATLQLPRGSLAGCSSWRLRFAVHSNGVNSSRRSSSWQWDGICASRFLWRLRGSATMFPKDKRTFPASHDRMSIGFRLFLEGLHLVKG